MSPHFSQIVVIMFGDIDDCNVAPLPNDAQCYVVNSRLTLYTTNPSDSSSIVQDTLRNISMSMGNGELAKSNDVIIKLIYVDQTEKNIINPPSQINRQVRFQNL